MYIRIQIFWELSKDKKTDRKKVKAFYLALNYSDGMKVEGSYEF